MALALKVSRHFVRQQLIPYLPTEPVRELLSDLYGPTSVFAIDGQHFYHKVVSLLRHDMSTPTQVVLANDKRQQEHNSRGDGQHHEGINIRQGLRLHLQAPVDACIG